MNQITPLSFPTGDAVTVCDALARRLRPAAPRREDHWRGRAVALIDAVAPALVWLRDHRGVRLDMPLIRRAIQMRWIDRLVSEGFVLLPDPATGVETEIDVAGEIPDEVIWPLQVYLADLPGFDATLPVDQQSSEVPYQQHGYNTWSLAPLVGAAVS